jgi:glutamate transport system substrate-binding protein
MRRAKLSFLALVAAGALALSGCAGTPSNDPVENPEFPAGSTMAKLYEAQSITIGTKFDQPLFGLVNPNNVPEGFDVEIGKIIAAELGIAADKIKWVETVSANREPFIENGQVDIVIATYTINDKRKESISFAGPYYFAGQSILVLANNTDINGPDDLKGKKVCSVTGSTPAEKLAEIGAEPVLTDAYSNCLEPLRNGQVVAVSTDNVILAGLAAQNEGEFKLAGTPFTDEPYGIGLAKNDTEFRMWINDIIEKAYKDGRYKAAWEKTAGTIMPYVDPPAVNRY